MLERGCAVRHRPLACRGLWLPVRSARTGARRVDPARAARRRRHAGPARGLHGHPAGRDQREPASLGTRCQLGRRGPQRPAAGAHARHLPDRRVPGLRRPDRTGEGRRRGDRSGRARRAAAEDGRQGPPSRRATAVRCGRGTGRCPRPSGVPGGYRRRRATRCWPERAPRRCWVAGRSRSVWWRSNRWRPGRRSSRDERARCRRSWNTASTDTLVDDLVEAEHAVRLLDRLDRQRIRRRALERFSATRMADRYEWIYRSLLAAARQPAAAPATRELRTLRLGRRFPPCARPKKRSGSRGSRSVAVPVKVSAEAETSAIASRASITSAAPTTLTLPTHDLVAGAALTA